MILDFHLARWYYETVTQNWWIQVVDLTETIFALYDFGRRRETNIYVQTSFTSIAMYL